VDTSELGTPLVVLAILGLVAFLVFRILQYARQKREERRLALRLVGFEPATGASAGDRSALIDLCRPEKAAGRFEVENLLERRGADHRIFLFDLRDAQRDEGRSAVLAVTSPRLAMPRFKVFPRIEPEGRLVALANAVIEKMIALEGTVVSFDDSAFSRRYTVAGADEGEIRRFLDGDRRARLAEREGLMIDAEGRSFAVDRLRFGRGKDPADVADVTQRVEEAERLLRLFASDR